MSSPNATPSGDAALTYESGAGWLPAPADDLPAAFKSLAELLFFWEIKAPSVIAFPKFTVYSLNGVPVHEAVCVKIHLPPNTLFELWVLYMAPTAARKGWYYMATWLKAVPGIDTGPVVTGLTVARYVAIKNQGNIGTIDNWQIICNPDMSKLTAL